MKTSIDSLMIGKFVSVKVCALACFAALFAACAVPAAAATTITWTGGGGDGWWNDAANWNPNTLIGVNTNDVLDFNGTTGLNNTNNIAGDTNAGIVFLPGAGAFTLNPVAGDTTLQGGNIVCDSTNLQTINLNLELTGNRVFEPENGVNAAGMVFNGVISQVTGGTYAFALYPAPAIYIPGQGFTNNGGTVTLTAANTFGNTVSLGATSAAAGYATNQGAPTLILNFAAPNAPQNDILYNGLATPGALTLCGGNLVMEGAANLNNLQSLGNINNGPGESTIQVIAGANGNAALQCGSIEQGQANGNQERECVMNFILPAGTQSATNGITTTIGVDPNIGIFTTAQGGGREFADYVVNSTSWATLGGSGSNIVAYPQSAYLTDLTTPLSNQDVIASATVTAAPESGSGRYGSLGTLRFNTAAPITLTITNSQALYGGAILVTPNCGNNVQIITGTNGPGSELYGLSYNGLEGLNLLQFNTNAPLLITNINVISSGQLNITGGGEVILASNSAVGSTANPCISVNSGELEIYNNASLGVTTSGGGFQLNNGTLIAAATINLNDTAGTAPRSMSLGNLGGTLDVLGTNTLTFSGNILIGNSSGGSGGSLAKTGAGNLVFTVAETYPAPTFVEQGTFTVEGALTGGAALVVGDGATLVDSGAVSITPASLYLGSATGCTNGFIGLSSTTTAPIQTTNLDANGATTINVGGILNIGVYPLISFVNDIGKGNFVIGSLPVGVTANIITNNSAIALNVTAVPIPIVWSGGVNNNWNDTTANWIGASTVYGDGDAVLFNDAASQFNVNLAVNVTPGSIVVTNNQNPYTFSGPNSILGGTLLKTGANSLTLAVNDASSGGISVSAGTLIVGDGTINGAVTSGNIVDNSTLEFAETNGSCDVPISGSGSVIINSGDGVYMLAGIETYLGNTIVTNGTFETTAIPFAAGGGNLIVSSNGLLNIAGATLTVNGLFGNGVVDNQASGSVTFTIGANNTNSAFTGTISNTAGLVTVAKTGAGTLFLTGSNTFTGGVQFNAGIVNAASLSDYSDDPGEGNNPGPSALGQRAYSQDSGGSEGFLFQGGTLQYTGSTPQETDREIRLGNVTTNTIDASGSNPNAILYWSWGDQYGANSDLFSGTGTRTLQLTGSNTGTNTLDIQIADQAANPTAVIKSGTGTWYMLGAASATPDGNFYSGLTTVNAGVLFIATTHNDYNGSVPTTMATGVNADSDGLGPFTLADGATLGVMYTGDSSDYPALMSTLTVGSSAGATLMFTNLQPGMGPMISATNTVFHNGTIVCSTNSLVPGTYQLLSYGKLSGSYLLGAMPGPYYYSLTNDGVNLDLTVSTTPPFNFNPTNIVFGVTNGQMTLSWPADHKGWQLQAQTNKLSVGISTNWVNVSGSTATNQVTIPINLTNGTVFFRLMTVP